MSYRNSFKGDGRRQDQGEDRDFPRSDGYGYTAKPTWRNREKDSFYDRNPKGSRSTHRVSDYKPIEKNLFNPRPEYFQRSSKEILEFCLNSEITIIRGKENCPAPVMSFGEAGLPSPLLEQLTRQGFSRPTAIQAQGWPIALSGHNMVAVAMTGSGKTIGFVIPAIMHIQRQAGLNNTDGPIVVILAPTRELAQQIHEVATNLGQVCGIYSVCVAGGAPKWPQIKALKEGSQIVVATPGRLNDLLDAGSVDFSKTTFAVLDEADRMLDMGFEPQIRTILSKIRPDRQFLMWSATWPKEVKKLAEDFIGKGDYIHVNIGSQGLSANHNITQIVDVCEEHEKERKMRTLLNEIILAMPGEKIIIFARTKRSVDEMTRAMRAQGIDASCIHGDKNQGERDWVLSEFRAGKTKILVATDVAARGLDVDDVKFVINYDYPNNSEEYVHRIGRTGRKGSKGTSYTFFTPKDQYKSKDLVALLEEAKQTVNPRLKELVSNGEGKRNYYSKNKNW